jgi:hypothetical protein
MVDLENLVEIGHTLGNVHQALENLIYYYRKVAPELRARMFRDFTARLSRLAKSLPSIPQSPGPKWSPRMSRQDLVYALIQLADDADAVSNAAPAARDLPDPIRAGILDRIMQLASLLRGFAYQIDQIDPKPKCFNVHIDTQRHAKGLNL